jgi:hypothetical protein
MIKFKDMMEMVINGQDSIICAVKDANADNAECINEMLLTGKYWIRSKQGGEIYPAIPKELWDADSAWGIATDASYIIYAPDFDQEAYWNTVSKNPAWFRKKAKCVNTDISCEKILRLDAEKISVVEDFKAMAAANNLTPGELIGYLFEKLS